ncbi:MAG: tetratricopeptide repeat protein [Gammaproteobacteria bacterium]|nr:tetratricopeptide repeat protein [Gammaproteobacteria bacterium]
MDDDFLTDEQQAAQVKSWLRQNGPFLAAGVVLGLGGLFGWNQWQTYQVRRAEAASVLYDQLLQSVGGQQVEAAAGQLKQLESEFASSAYVDQGRLSMAGLYVLRSRPDEAIAQLQLVVDNSDADEIRHLARLRLARLLSSGDRHEEALKALDVSGTGAFTPLFHDVRGDVYYAMGKLPEARSEYEQALNGESAATVLDPVYVTAKLDELGGSTAELAAASGLPGAVAGDVPAK